MTERKIQNALYWHLYKKGHRSICPNYTPRGWWECDLFSVTRAGYFVEHEVKLSVSDFRADAKKEREIFGDRPDGKWGKTGGDKKHDLLGAEHTPGPSRFFYVVPEDLIQIADVPAWAGLIYAYEHRKRVHLRMMKDAPVLHRTKVDPVVLSHVESVFSYRFWRLRLGLPEAEDQPAISDRSESLRAETGAVLSAEKTPPI